MIHFVKIFGLFALCSGVLGSGVLGSGVLGIGVLGIGAATETRAEEPARKPYYVVVPGHKPVKARSGPRADPPGGVLTPDRDFETAQIKPPAKAYTGQKIDVTEFHYNPLRTGWNGTETDLTPTTVASANFGKLKTIAVDGTVFAQPLLLSDFVMPDKTKHDVLLVATAHNSLYAIDARTYATLWQVNVGKSQDFSDVSCSDVVPEYGIMSTPVVIRSSPSSAVIYFVAALEPQPFQFQTNIYAYDVGSGTPYRGARRINPSATLSDASTLGFDPRNQWSRAGLVYANNSIYVSIGSHCDNNAGAISGWMLKYSPTLIQQATFHTIGDFSSYELSSIWMSGFAPAVDETGNLFVVTGNGSFDVNTGGKNYGESILQILPDLSGVKDWFTPSDFTDLNNADADFGSGGVMLLPRQGPRTPLAVAMGKAQSLFVVNRNNLGKLTNGDAKARQVLSYPGGGVWGGPAFYSGPIGDLLFYQSGGDTLRSFKVDTSSTTPLSAFASGTTGAGYGGSMPIVSSLKSANGPGVVWVVRRTMKIQLEAYAADALGDPIFAGTAGTWPNSANNSFLTAMEANGRVFVGADKTVTVFGLKQ